MDVWMYINNLFILGIFLPLVKGKIMCECTTLDCEAERRRTCEADYQCYVETQNSVVTRGCINQKTPLLCENRRPDKLSSGLHGDWPFLFCCKDEDFCNREVVPIKPTEKVKETEIHTPDDYNPYVKTEYEPQTPPCPHANNGDNSILNPVYIAVPVAGVCVLLALIIFAMYLLRRRNDMYANYDAYKYHEQLARLATKQNEVNTQSCEVNRLTDSERSSQGSAAKLFLTA